MTAPHRFSALISRAFGRPSPRALYRRQMASALLALAGLLAMPETVAADPPRIFWAADHGPEQFDDDWQVRGVGKRMGGVNSADAIAVSEGQIRINASSDGTQLTVGAVRTRPAFAIRYGRVEVEMKICLANGLRAAAWLQSDQNFGRDGQIGPGSEIDIIEVIPGLRTYAAHNLHWGGYQEQHRHTGQKVALRNPCDWHRYHVDWSADSYRFGIDGRETWRTAEGVSHADEYLILSIEAPDHLKPAVREALLSKPDLGYIAVRDARWIPSKELDKAARPSK
jgi:beta-glucanase (GH16 family)